MKMPNDDFLEPLKKRPNTVPRKEFTESLHERMFEEVSRRRSMASWNFRLGMVAVLLLLVIINPFELMVTENSEENFSSSEKGDQAVANEAKEEQVYEDEEKVPNNKHTDLDQILNSNPHLKAQFEKLSEAGVEHGKSSAFILYQYGLLTKDVNIIIDNGFFSSYQQESMISKLIDYYEKNVDLSTLTITNIERSLAEPDFFITAQYHSYDGTLMEVNYVLTGYYGQVLDWIVNQHSYFTQKKIIEENGATIAFPYFSGQLKGIGESSHLEELNTLIQNQALITSYDNYLGFHGNVTAEIIYDIDSMLSIEFQVEWSSEEMAHPYAKSTFLTFDLRKGRALELLDFTSEKELAILEDKMKNIIKIDEKLANIYTEELTIKTDHSFYLSTFDGNFVLYFPRYELSSLIEAHIHPVLGILER